MAAMRALLAVVLGAIACAGCALLPASIPEGAYFPSPADPGTRALSRALHRAALAAGDDPAGYSFARIPTREVTAVNAPDSIFYFSDGLAALPAPELDALVAHAVAHERLGHERQRRALSLSVSVGFSALGFVVPGLGLADFLVNPLVVRAYSREQHLAADRKTVELLRAMGHESPRRLLASALRAAGAVNGPAGGLLATEPSLDDRLLALEPLEPATALARARR
jgi:Zn-dependent protease with chaperone function